MKINLKTCFAGLVAAALVGGAVADTKVRLRDGNNFIVEYRTSGAELQKVYEAGGVRITNLTTDQREELNLATADAGTLIWDTDFKRMFTWNGTSWKINSKPFVYAEQLGDVKAMRDAFNLGETDRPYSVEKDMDFNLNAVVAPMPDIINCEGVSCTVKLAGAYRIVAQVYPTRPKYYYYKYGRLNETHRGLFEDDTVPAGGKRWSWIFNPGPENMFGVGRKTDPTGYAFPIQLGGGQIFPEDCRASVTLNGRRLAPEFGKNSEWSLRRSPHRHRGMAMTNNVIDLAVGDRIGIKTYDTTDLEDGSSVYSDDIDGKWNYCINASLYIEGPLSL